MTNQDSPLRLTNIEEYRKQRAQETEPVFTVVNDHMVWLIQIEAKTPRGRHKAIEIINATAPFLRWRMKLAKRRLLREWKIVCEMES